MRLTAVNAIAYLESLEPLPLRGYASTMSKLLSNRWLYASLLAGILIALGVGIYRVQPPEPMCVIEATRIEPRYFADGGRLLVGWLDRVERIGHARTARPGPLRIWNPQTGLEVARYLTEKQGILSSDSSRDRRHFAAEIVQLSENTEEDVRQKRSLFFLDVVTGGVREARVEGSAGDVTVAFSPGGKDQAR